MSQSGFTPIQLYRSATPGAVPLAGNLAPGELAINTADQKLFFENASGTVVASVPFNTTGVLDVANGGTGASTLTANYILKGNGTSAVSSSVLYENGGYLGIGTTGPAVLFDAQQTLNGSGGISYTNLSTGASSAASITAEAGGSYLTLNVTRATGVVQFRGVTATTLNQDFTTQIFRSTGATEYMRITSAGNVGIGTSAPGYKLQVAADGAGGGNQIAIAGVANANNRLYLGYDTSSNYARIQAITEGTATRPLALNPDGGNVGIGTTAPGYKLDVSATGNISGQFKTSGSINALFLADAGTTAETLYVGTVGNDFRVVTGSNERMRVTSVGDVGIGTSAPTRRLSISGGDVELNANVLYLNSGNAFIQGNSTNILFSTNATERVRIDSSGYLLVGATSSVGVGAVRTQIGSAASAASGLLLKSTTASLSLYASSGTSANLVWNSGNFMAFGTGPDNLSSFAEYMRITATGNVGIGTGTPVGRLMVAAADTSNVIGSATASINITNTDAGAFGRTANLNFTVDDGTLATRRLATISGVYTGFGGGGTEGALAFATQFNGSLNERMRLDASGNLGIGTTAPTNTLTVQGTVAFNVNSTTDVFKYFTGGAGLVYAGTTTATAIGFLTSGGERMRLDTSGNLLVGTTTTGGAANNLTRVTAGIFSTTSGSAPSLTTAVATTIFTLTNTAQSQTWLVSADLISESSTSYACVYIVTLTNNSITQAVQLVKGNLSSITVSGLNVQYTQSSGGTKTNGTWSAVRIM